MKYILESFLECKRLLEGKVIKQITWESDFKVFKITVEDGAYVYVEGNMPERKLSFLPSSCLSALPNVKSEPRPYMARAVRKHSP